MNKQNILSKTSAFYIGLSILSLAYVSVLSILSPQATMDLVQVKLENNDAISSIRGVYGGVGMAIVSGLVFLFYKHRQYALAFLVVFWGAYAISRLITIFADGALGAFGNQWIVIESVLCLTGLLLLVFNTKKAHA